MLNTISLMGRLTRDPELRRTQSGTAVTSFTLAVDRDFTSADGTTETDSLDAVAWPGPAAPVSTHLPQGRMAVVKGRLQLRDWQDKEGNKRRSAEVMAESVFFADSRAAGSGTSAQPSTPGFSEITEADEPDEDLPF